MEATYTPKTSPLSHQAKDIELYAGHRNRARWWEQGTGKTKPTIDEVGMAFVEGRIDALLIVAPKGVDWNWVNDELPKHLGLPFIAHVWKTAAATTTKWHKEAVRKVLYHDDPSVLPVLVIGYDACKTDEANKAIEAFLKVKRVAMVVDEATRIKNPNKTTKRIQKFGRKAVFRRLLNGTPVADSPFHAYTQCQFIDGDIWKPLGITTMAAMKSYFGVWEKRFSEGREYPHLLRHRNMQALADVLAAVGTRYAKDDVLDLPPKVYRKHYFDLNGDQQRMYDQLEREYRTWFGDGTKVTAKEVIVRQTRLQQITCGYVPADDEDELRDIGKRNVRLLALLDLLEDVPGQVIIWARYDRDIDVVSEALRGAGETVCVVDGRTSDADREEAKQGFQAGRFRYFVAKPNGPAGRGLTLTAAKTVIYYSNTYSGDDRAQSEDRAHRIGQEDKVLYIDLCARGTVDEYILKVLSRKIDLSARLMGDALPTWH